MLSSVLVGCKSCEKLSKQTFESHCRYPPVLVSLFVTVFQQLGAQSMEQTTWSVVVGHEMSTSGVVLVVVDTVVALFVDKML